MCNSSQTTISQENQINRVVSGLKNEFKNKNKYSLCQKILKLLGRAVPSVGVGIILPDLSHLLSKLPSKDDVVVRDNLYGGRYLSSFMQPNTRLPYILFELEKYTTEWVAKSGLEEKEIVLEKLENATRYVHLEEHPKKEQLFYLLKLLRENLLR